MKIHRLHGWEISISEARALQSALASKVESNGQLNNPSFIAGLDVSSNGPRGTAQAAIVVLAYPSLEAVEVRIARGKLLIPYIPGLLSFREMPLLLIYYLRKRIVRRMKFIFNIVKWGMLAAGVIILSNVKFEQGGMTARSQSKMGNIVICPQTNGYLQICDNYEHSAGIYLCLKDKSLRPLFTGNKIRVYIKENGSWRQLEAEKGSGEIFFIPHHHYARGKELENIVDLKYEVHFKGKSPGLIVLQPSRIYCGMEFFRFIPGILLGISLIFAAFIGEWIWLIVGLFRKKKSSMDADAPITASE